MPPHVDEDELAAALAAASARAGDRAQRAARVADAIRRFGGYRWVGIYDVTTDEIAVIAWDGPAPPAHPRFPRSQGLCGAAAAAGEAVIVGDVAADPRYLTTHMTTRSEIVVPVLAGGVVVGLIDVESERPHAFADADKQLLTRCAAVIVPLWRDSNSVRVRPAESTDVPAVSALAKRTWADAFGSSVSPEDEAVELEETRSEQYFHEALRNDTILVAEVNGELVGYVQFGVVKIPEVDTRPGDQQLHRVYVDTQLHGRGIGRELMNAALAHPRLVEANRIFLQVWEENRTAVALYESLGFRTVGRTTFAIGSGEIVEDDVMLLDRASSVPPANRSSRPTRTSDRE